MPPGDPAPRLGEVDLSPETAREYHRFLIRQIVRMLSIGLIHGDLSEFNVLVGPDGPVIIDLPQAVNAAGNNGALAMLERDVNNIRGTLGRFAPELLETEFAREMWALFEQGELTADSEAHRCLRARRDRRRCRRRPAGGRGCAGGSAATRAGTRKLVPTPILRSERRWAPCLMRRHRNPAVRSKQSRSRDPSSAPLQKSVA